MDRMAPADRTRALMAALLPFNQAADADLWPRGRDGVTRDPRLLEWGI